MIENDYEVVVADSKEMRRMHHRIRYQVYCLETGYEDPGAFPNGMEEDEWDGHSIPFLVRHRPSGRWVGTMRLVPSVEGRLPVFGLLGADPQHDDLSDGGMWEISRVCIPSAYRRRSARRAASLPGWRAASPVGVKASSMGFSQDRSVIRGMHMRPRYSWSGGADGGECLDVRARRAIEGIRFDHTLGHGAEAAHETVKVESNAVILVLFHAAVMSAAQRGGTALYFLVRPSLARLLQRLQIPIECAGDGCEHRGMRFPYRVDLGVLASIDGHRAAV